MNTNTPKAIQRRMLSRPISPVFVAVLAFGLSLTFQMFWSAETLAQSDQLCPANPDVKDLCANPQDECLKAALQVDLKPISPENHRVLELVNCSTTTTLLGAANAAQNKDSTPTSVLPREGTWKMAPFDPNDTKHKNVLVIDVPPQWENTKCGQSVNERKACEKNGVVGPGCGREPVAVTMSISMSLSARPAVVAADTIAARLTRRHPPAPRFRNGRSTSRLRVVRVGTFRSSKILRISARWMASISIWTSGRSVAALAALSTTRI